MFKQTILRSLIALVLSAATATLFAVPANFPAFAKATAGTQTSPEDSGQTSNFELQTSNFKQMVTLSAGTAVSVTLNEAIDAESVSVGNSLDFTVRSNVTVNGKVLIAAGATATGWVKSVKKGCGGKCTEITITVENAMAVDGQMVNLRSIPHLVRVPCGESATANIGTNLSARVLNDIRIDA